MRSDRSPSQSLLAVAAVAFVMMIASERRLSHVLPWKYPPVNELVVNEHYLSDLGTLFLGAHRLAADVAYIQFLQYYGVPPAEEGDDHVGHSHGPGDHHGEVSNAYPRLLHLARRYLRLDPFFNAAILEAAGALAFNQKRATEGSELLAEAIRLDPTFYRYHLYAAAILYKEKGDDKRLIDTLLEASRYPDCPALVKLVLGNLLRKTGRYLEAGQIYINVAETSAGEADRHDATMRLANLLRERPGLARQLSHPLPRD